MNNDNFQDQMNDFLKELNKRCLERDPNVVIGVRTTHMGVDVKINNQVFNICVHTKQWYRVYFTGD